MRLFAGVAKKVSDLILNNEIDSIVFFLICARSNIWCLGFDHVRA